ncbi:MAG: TlpA family protein disulfide reductase [Desulfobulbaceae bacterium]|nr:TlpA family protein disulfide reductase [Desulfobulbaceae bacterium]HIJ79213.1 TlpA family protein disulfide reductase [Deltaproteobacteria bacterium]
MISKKILSIFLVPFTLSLLLIGCDQKTQIAEEDKPAPNFTLMDTKGKTWQLNELKGQVVMVNFWATWCPPCRSEMPSMQKIYTTLPADKFKILAILSNDDPAIADSLAKKGGFTFPILVDPENKAAQAYGITGVPETFIVDKQGIIREKYIGAVRWDSADGLAMLRRYINR